MIRILVHKKCLNTSIFFYSIYVEKQYNSIDKYRGSWGERVFWLNIAKFEINLCYSYCSNLFRNLRKESEFQQYHCRNSTKVGERKRKSGREKFFIFDNTITEIPSAYIFLSYFDNVIATFHFFFLRNDMFTQFLQYFYNKF